jgi:CysZ protein
MVMIRDFFRAIGQLADAPTRGVIWRSLLLAVLCFVALVGACSVGLHSIDLFGADWAWLDTSIDVLGDVVAFWLAWLMLPGVLAAASGLFLDRVIDRAEARYFPGLPPARSQPLSSQIANSLRLFGATILINLVVLPLYLYLPVLNIGIWLVVNGYLIGCDYFEMVAQRRMSIRDAKRLRVAAGFSAIVDGMIVATMMVTPFINLIAAVVGIAYFTHRVLRRPEARGEMAG